GTVGKVARRLVGRRLPIAVLPLGTANNISKTLGVADLPLADLISGLSSARRVKFDAGVAIGPWGKRHFIEGIGAGLFAQAVPVIERSGEMARLEGAGEKIAFALKTLRERLAKAAAFEIRGSLDGEDISAKYLMLEAMHMQYVGPN